MPKKARLTQANIIKALKANCGLVSPAARDLGCSRGAIYANMKRRPKIKAALDDMRQENLDFAESALYAAARNGHGWAVCFLLKCLGKERGFNERVEVTSKEPLKIEITKFGPAGKE